jgi:hypothetical protein
MTDLEATIRGLEERLWKAQLTANGALKITKLEPLEVRVRAIPGGAITSVKMDAAAFVAGKVTSAILRYTRVWICEGGRWQIAGGHMSMVPAR